MAIGGSKSAALVVTVATASLKEASAAIDNFIKAYNGKKIQLDVVANTDKLGDLTNLLKGGLGGALASGNGRVIDKLKDRYGVDNTSIQPDIDTSKLDESIDNATKSIDPVKVETKLDSKAVKATVDDATKAIESVPIKAEIDSKSIKETAKGLSEITSKGTDSSWSKTEKLSDKEEQYLSAREFADTYRNLKSVLNNPYAQLDSKVGLAAADLAERRMAPLMSFLTENPSADNVMDFDESAKAYAKAANRWSSELKANIEAQKPIIDQIKQYDKSMESAVKLGGQDVKNTDAYKAMVAERQLLEDSRKYVGSSYEKGKDLAGNVIKSTRDADLAMQMTGADLSKAHDLSSNLDKVAKSYSKFTVGSLDKEIDTLQKFYDTNKKIHGLDEGNAVEKRIKDLTRLSKAAHEASSIDEGIEQYNAKQRKNKKATLERGSIFAEDEEILRAARTRANKMADIGEISGTKLSNTLDKIQTDLYKNANASFTKEGKALQKDVEYIQSLQEVAKFKKDFDYNKRLIADGKTADYLDQVNKRQRAFDKIASQDQYAGRTAPENLAERVDQVDAFLRKNMNAFGTEKFTELSDLNSTMKSILTKNADATADSVKFQKDLQAAGLSGKNLDKVVAQSLREANRDFTDRGITGTTNSNAVMALRSKVKDQISKYEGAVFKDEGTAQKYDELKNYGNLLDQVVERTRNGTGTMEQNFRDLGAGIVSDMKSGNAVLSDFNDMVSGKMIQGTNKFEKTYGDVSKFVNSIGNDLKSWNVAKDGFSSGEYASLEELQVRGRNLMSQMSEGILSENYVQSEMTKMKTLRDGYNSIIKGNGENAAHKNTYADVEKRVKNLNNLIDNNKNAVNDDYYQRAVQHRDVLQGLLDNYTNGFDGDLDKWNKSIEAVDLGGAKMTKTFNDVYSAMDKGLQATGNMGNTSPEDVSKMADSLDLLINKNKNMSGTQRFEDLSSLRDNLRGLATDFKDAEAGNAEWQKALGNFGYKGHGLTDLYNRQVADFKYDAEMTGKTGNTTYEKFNRLRKDLNRQAAEFANAQFDTEDQQALFNDIQRRSNLMNSVAVEAANNGYDLESAFNKAGISISDAMDGGNKAVSKFTDSVDNKLIKGTETFKKTYDDVNKVFSDTSKQLDLWKIAETGDATKSYAGLQQANKEASEIMQAMEAGSLTASEAKERLRSAKATADLNRASIKAAGEDMDVESYQKQVRDMFTTSSKLYESVPDAHGLDFGNRIQSQVDILGEYDRQLASTGNAQQALIATNQKFGTSFSQASIIKDSANALSDLKIEAMDYGKTGISSLDKVNAAYQRGQEILSKNPQSLYSTEAQQYMSDLYDLERIRDYGMRNQGADLNKYANQIGVGADIFDRLTVSSANYTDSIKKVGATAVPELSDLKKAYSSLSSVLDTNRAAYGEDWFQQSSQIREALGGVIDFAETSDPSRTLGAWSKDYQRYTGEVQKYITDTFGVKGNNLNQILDNVQSETMKKVQTSTYSGNGITPEEMIKASQNAYALMAKNKDAIGTSWYSDLENFAKSSSDIGQAFRSVGTDAKEFQDALRGKGWAGDNFSQINKDLTDTFKNMNAINDRGGTTGISAFNDSYERLGKTISKYRGVEFGYDSDSRSMDELTERYNRFGQAQKLAEKKSIALQDAFQELGFNMADEVKTANDMNKALNNSLSGQILKNSANYNNKLRETASLSNKITTNMQNWSKAAKSDKSSAAYQRMGQIRDEVDSLNARTASGQMDAGDYERQFTDLQRQYEGMESIIKQNGDNTLSFSDKIKSAVGKFSSWYVASQLMMMGVSKAKEAVSNVVDMDSAMTELKKVTDETAGSYDKFYKTAGQRASKYGATVTDTINATADFARLGYGIADASEAADAAIVYKNVGDGIEDIGTASESIISTLKAFERTDTNLTPMSIVDKFNEVGKELPKGVVIRWVYNPVSDYIGQRPEVVQTEERFIDCLRGKGNDLGMVKIGSQKR